MNIEQRIAQMHERRDREAVRALLSNQPFVNFVEFDYELTAKLPPNALFIEFARFASVPAASIAIDTLDEPLAAWMKELVERIQLGSHCQLAIGGNVWSTVDFSDTAGGILAIWRLLPRKELMVYSHTTGKVLALSEAEYDYEAYIRDATSAAAL